MGRGDKRTRKGKIFRASYGISRPRVKAEKVAAGGKAKTVAKPAADKKKK